MEDYEEVKSSDWTPSLFICLGAGHEQLNVREGDDEQHLVNTSYAIEVGLIDALRCWC